MAEKVTEISFEVPASEVAVIDGYCQAKNLKRTQVFRRILREWSEAKHHEATLFIRVAGSKPDASSENRDAQG